MMKRIILLCIVFGLSSCSKEEYLKQNSSEINLKADKEQLLAERSADSALSVIDERSASEFNLNPKVEEAKSLIDEASKWMNYAIRGEVSKQDAKKHVEWAMKDFEKLNNTLSIQEQGYLRDHRLKKIQESIDLQIQYGNK